MCSQIDTELFINDPLYWRVRIIAWSIYDLVHNIVQLLLYQLLLYVYIRIGLSVLAMVYFIL